MASSRTEAFRRHDEVGVGIRKIIREDPPSCVPFPNVHGMHGERIGRSYPVSACHEEEELGSVLCSSVLWLPTNSMFRKHMYFVTYCQPLSGACDRHLTETREDADSNNHNIINDNNNNNDNSQQPTTNQQEGVSPGLLEAIPISWKNSCNARRQLYQDSRSTHVSCAKPPVDLGVSTTASATKPSAERESAESHPRHSIYGIFAT